MNFLWPVLILASWQQWGDHCTSSSGLRLVLNWLAGCPVLPERGLQPQEECLIIKGDVGYRLENPSIIIFQLPTI